MSGVHEMTEPPGVRSPRLGRRALSGMSGGAAVLIGLCALGLWAMTFLQDRADRAIEVACGRTGFPSTVRWEHGYHAALPVGSLAVAVLAVVVSIVVLAARASPGWSRMLSALTLAAGCLTVPAGALMTHDFFAFPGGDISTVSSSPCGVG